MIFPWFEQFERDVGLRLTQRKLHHALLLKGQQGIGKHALASALAKHILCKTLGQNYTACGKCQSCQLYDAGNHPDFQWLTTDKSQLGVDTIRAAIDKLQSKSQLGHNKVLVIPNCHQMSESAANALLKTLEEPTANTYILMVTHQHTRLLPTILSRCEKHTLTAPSLSVSVGWLKDLVADDPAINPFNSAIDENLLTDFACAPLLALESLQHEHGLQYERIKDDLRHVINGEADLLALSQEWQDSSEQIIEWVQRFVNEELKTCQYASGKQWEIVQHINEASQKVRHPGVQKAMLLFALLNQLSFMGQVCS